MSAHEPHRQLKSIRGKLGITQKRLAEMLGVSYPYLLSVETGQRDMSEPLARKIGWLLGVPQNRIRDKQADPVSWDREKKELVPFSKETFQKSSTQLPTFRLPEDQTPVTPTLEGYAKAFHALLDSALAKQRLGTALEGFFALFREVISSDKMLDAFQASYRKLYPHDDGDARHALEGQICDMLEREISRPKRERKPPK